MKNKLIRRIKSLWQNVKQEFSEKPIASTGVLVGIFFVLIPLLLSESLRDFFGYLLSSLFQPTIKLSILPLAIVSVVLLAAFLTSFKLKSKPKKDKNHYFIPYGDFTWKIDLSYGYPQVDKTPYCKDHQKDLECNQI